ncbi:hypothetical protein B0J17DRAFT_773134 [Rhizoctonia solani]|nr:hypothetical protein B0J17DRAFT_773134 [Rhizoctonia solani]
MTLPDLKSALQLPERAESTQLVFRVFDDTSHQYYSSCTGFTAEPNLIDRSNPDAVRRSVEERIQFSNPYPTSWISTTHRWLWAVWEANRRFNRSGGRRNVRIAIIDLAGCQAANKNVSIPSLGYDRLSFIHSISGLSSAEIIFKRFAGMSDEILIYEKIPASAVISIWHFNNRMSALPIQYIHYLPPCADPDLAQDFRSNHNAVAAQFLEERQNKKWDATREGESCATAALVLLHEGYIRLFDDLGEIVKLAWKSSAQNAPRRRSLRIMARNRDNASSSQHSEVDKQQLPPLPHAFVILLADKVVDNLIGLTDPFCGDKIETVTTEVIMHMSCGTDSRRLTYERFLVHKKSLMARIANHIQDNGEEQLFLDFPFASGTCLVESTIFVQWPLKDELQITRSEWALMKCGMLGVVAAKLAPLYEKLDALLIEHRLKNELVDQAKAHHLDAGVKWVKKEVEYPLWWE